MSFRNRMEAGRQLAAPLVRFRDEDPVVLALPRGGVAVAAPIAAALAAPLDLVLVRKIGVPDQPELAMGAVVDGEAPVIVRNRGVIASLGISGATFDAVCRREMAEIERRRRLYLGDRAPVPCAHLAAVLLDLGGSRLRGSACTRSGLAARARHDPAVLARIASSTSPAAFGIGVPGPNTAATPCSRR